MQALAQCEMMLSGLGVVKAEADDPASAAQVWYRDFLWSNKAKHCMVQRMVYTNNMDVVDRQWH